MAADQSFTDLMDRLNAGDDAAAAEIFHRFAHRLIGLARTRLDRLLQAKVDPEDVMQSVYRSFFRRHLETHYDLDGWDGLWGMLTVITLRKCGHRGEYFRAARRDVRRETSAANGRDQPDLEFACLARDPTPSHAARLAETVEQVMRSLEGRERDIFALSLQGCTAAEISEQVGRTERTVQRVLKRVREQLLEMKAEAAERREGFVSMLAISLEQLVDQFEEAWQSGERPDIDAFLPADDRLPALVELVHIDLERRAKSGEDIRVESYLQRYAELNEKPIVGELLAAEFQLRSRRDPSITHDEFTQRFPQLRDEITGFTIPAPSVNGDQLPATWTVAGEASGPPGTRVGPIVTRSNYSTLQLHARGGLGEVFVAHDEVLNRDVALKSLQAKRARDGVSRRRFLREAEITGRLEHPGVVPVYGLGQDAAGNPVYAMRFIRGQTFQQAIDQYHASTPRLDSGSRRLAFQQLLRSFLSVCNTIAYAHSRGIIHRDLKPGNILLGEYGETLVVDWGLAKATDEGGSVKDESINADSSCTLPPSSVQDTMTGDVIGTPAFMSPEQARGQIEEIGPASDIYSLGATLYVLLTGRPPFAPLTLVEALREVQRGAFVPPRQISRRISRGLEAVGLKAMALQPEQRYASALELARDLEHWLAGEPVSAWREPLTVTARRWLSRHATLATGTAVAIVAAAILAGVTAVLLAEKRIVDLRNEQSQNDLSRADREAYLHRVAQAGREWLKGQHDSARRYLGECKGELRQFEWHHLQRCLQSGPQALTGHAKEVWAVAYSRDGKRVASASLDGTVRIWDALTGQHLQTLTGHAGPVWGVDFHPDNARLATCSDDGTVRVWDSSTGKELSSIEMQVEVLGVAFSPDGNRLAACTFPGRSTNRAVTPPGRTAIIDLASGREVFQLLGHGSGIHSVAFSPDGGRLITAGNDGLVKAWELDTRKAISIYRGHRGSVFKAVFSPDGRTIASVSNDPSQPLALWDAGSGRVKHVLTGHQHRVWGVGFSPDGRRVATSSDDTTIRIWDVERGRLLFTLRGHTRGIANVAFSPDGEQLASASDDQTVRLWKAVNPGASVALTEHADKVNCVAISPNGNLAASVGDDRTLRVWNLASRRELTLLRTGDELTCVTFQPGGKRLACSGMDGMVYLWNIETQREEWSWTGHEAAVRCVAFSSDGDWLATAGNDSTVKIWRVSSRRLERTLSGHTGHVLHVAFSSNGRRIATASADKTVKLWDAATGDLLHDLTGYTSAVLCVAFSPDSGTIATSTEKTPRVVTGEPGQIKLWNAETAEELDTLHGHFSSVTCVAFTGDGKRLISSSDDGTVKIWDRASGQDLLTLPGHTSGVRSVAIHPANRLLISGGSDGNVILWYGQPWDQK